MEIKDIQISDIKIKENIRQTAVDENSSELMQSIKDVGLLQPIGIKEEKNGNYTLIWGYRRLRACKNLGWKKISAVIFLKKNEELSEDEFLIINATENLQRRPNTLFELGRVLIILRRTMSIGEIAVKLAIPKSRVETALNEMQRLPKTWHKRIRVMSSSNENKKGDIPINVASKVARIRGLSKKQKESLLNYTSKNDIPASGIDAVASQIKNGRTIEQAIKDSKNYRFINVKVYVDEKKFNKIIEDYESSIDFFVDCINKRVPGLAVKKVTQGGYNKR